MKLVDNMCNVNESYGLFRRSETRYSLSFGHPCSEDETIVSIDVYNMRIFQYAVVARTL